MARLIVEACSAEWTGVDIVYTLVVAVSVSRADDGKAVTGLKAENFHVASHIGSVKDFKVGAVSEWKWEPANVEPSGCYQVEISMTTAVKFLKGQRYIFGIQAQTFGETGKRQVIDQGQTVFELTSLGE